MTPSEYVGWTVYFEEREAQRQHEANVAAGVVDFADPKAGEQLIGMVQAAGGGKGHGHG